MAHGLPSGSAKNRNLPPSRGSSTCTSPTSSPRPTSSARAASMSVTTSWRLARGPGGVAGSTMTGPTVTEQDEPGGVICTTRIDSVGQLSTSRWKPSWST